LKFLIDRCAGRRLAEWLRLGGHDVVEARELGPDPGDRALLRRAEREGRVLVTIDTDFGHILFVEGGLHAGLVRLPDVPAEQRCLLMAEVLERHAADLDARAVVTVGRTTIRISRPT
jgi:predicted nuclease of predicted toxin-antitoxin system